MTLLKLPATIGAVLALVIGIVGVSAASARASETFGIETFENSILNQEGLPAAQAGSHPYAMTTTIVFNHHYNEEYKDRNGGNGELPDGDPKSLEVNLPAGLIVNPTATEKRCTENEIENTECPRAAAVGVATVDTSGSLGEQRAPVYTMVTPPGVPGEFAFNVTGVGVIVHIVGKVRTGTDYGLSADVMDITQKAAFYGAKLTLWGNPSDESHDKERGECGSSTGPGGSCPVARTGGPFLTLPSSCTGTLTATMRAQSWQEPNWTPLQQSSPAMHAVEGCGLLSFGPSLTAQPIGAQPGVPPADSPSGLSVNLQVPQEERLTGLATANLKNTVVTLPAGMAVSPSAANGLGACSEAEIGLHNAEEPSCPDDSKVAEAEIVTPLLEAPLKGSVYLAQQGNAGPAQGSNPFSSLLAIYLVAEGSGALIKLAGHVEADPSTGQLTTTFENNPQLPFSELKLSFFTGPRAPLVSPPACGTYTTTTQLTPWSAPFSGPPATPQDSFTLASGCGGGFAPSFTAGMESSQAGAFSPFSVTFSRQDGEQRLGGVQVTTPPGLLGALKSVVQCPEPQASAGACGPESLIGETTVAAGPGEDPYWVKGGRVYLTGPYKGAPFGLSIVVPAIAGPFNLGNVIVRAAITVDPHTAQVTVTSDPLPSILQGIPLDLRTVNVTVDRPGFMFNPTNCSPLTAAATIASTGGASAAVSSPFHVTNCAALAFKPSFTVSTQAKTSKANGASLDVKVISGSGQANIAKVDVTLPEQLPSRLTTLQKACTEAQFAANPAGCPAGSFVGVATAVTPVLNVPLTGPAILLSHGGAAFPDLVLILQGQGVTIELTGNTDIKKGITYSRFETVPDAPFSTFELKLPEGPHSILGAYLPAKANGSVCGQGLVMPTTITAQDGAVVTQTTKIAVTGCASDPKPLTRAQRLAKALRACRGKRDGKQRASCESQARNRYGTKAKKPNRRGGR
jgi:hypothetical protein